MLSPDLPIAKLEEDGLNRGSFAESLAKTLSRGGRRSCPPMRNTPRRGKTSTRSAGRWTTSSPTALPPALPSWEAVTTRRTGSRTSCRRYGKDQNTTTGCSATIMTTKPLTKGTSCSGSRSCRPYKIRLQRKDGRLAVFSLWLYCHGE